MKVMRGNTVAYLSDRCGCGLRACTRAWWAGINCTLLCEPAQRGTQIGFFPPQDTQTSFMVVVIIPIVKLRVFGTRRGLYPCSWWFYSAWNHNGGKRHSWENWWALTYKYYYYFLSDVSFYVLTGVKSQFYDWTTSLACFYCISMTLYFID